MNGFVPTLLRDLLVATVGLLISSAVNAASPNKPDNCDTNRVDIGLEETTGEAIEAFKGMVRSRGLPPRATDHLARDTGKRGVDGLRARGQHLPGTGLLIYGKLAERLCVWLITPQSIYVVPSTFTITEIQKKIRDLRNALGVTAGQLTRAPTLRGLVPAKTAVPAPVQREEDALDSMVDALLPLEVRRGLTEVRHLVVFPTLDIGTVPFGLLPAGAGRRSLIESMSISISTGLAEYVHSPSDDRWTGVEPTERFLVVGNPDLSDDKKWNFPNLPGAEREAKRLGEMFATQPLLGRNATADAVMKALPDVDYLFLATHAIADAKSPLDGSFIALAGSALTPRQIQNKRVKRNLLAVLSACQTGLGGEHDIGMLGLARAFQLAGAFATVMSLWNVDDEATYTLITAFAEGLRHSAPQEALRLAMLQTRKRYPEYSKWGSFVYFGHPMDMAKKN